MKVTGIPSLKKNLFATRGWSTLLRLHFVWLLPRMMVRRRFLSKLLAFDASPSWRRSRPLAGTRSRWCGSRSILQETGSALSLFVYIIKLCHVSPIFYQYPYPPLVSIPRPHDLITFHMIYVLNKGYVWRYFILNINYFVMLLRSNISNHLSEESFQLISPSRESGKIHLDVMYISTLVRNWTITWEVINSSIPSVYWCQPSMKAVSDMAMKFCRLKVLNK